MAGLLLCFLSLLFLNERRWGKEERTKGGRDRERGRNRLSLKAGMNPEQLRRLVSLSFSFIYVPKARFLTINSEFGYCFKKIINSLKTSYIHTAHFDQIIFYCFHVYLQLQKFQAPQNMADILSKSAIFSPIYIFSFTFKSLDLSQLQPPLL